MSCIHAYVCRSARRNLTRSFEEVAKQTSTGSISTLSGSGSGSEDRPTEEAAPQLTAGPLPSNQSDIGNTEDQSLLLAQPGNVRPEAPPPGGVVEGGRSEEVHHFCYAIDIRSVRNLSQQRPLSVWLR